MSSALESIYAVRDEMLTNAIATGCDSLPSSRLETRPRLRIGASGSLLGFPSWESLGRVLGVDKGDGMGL